MHLDHKLCVLPVFLFPVQIPNFYVKSQSLYAKFPVLISRWSTFYAKVLLWVHTHERCPVRPLWGGLCCTRKACCAKLVGGGGFRWVRLRRYARNYLGARYLLRQDQSSTWLSVQFPGPQRTWDLSFADHLGVRPCDRDCDLDVNPIFNMWNRALPFLRPWVNSNRQLWIGPTYPSCHQPIGKMETLFPLLVAVLPVLVLIHFSHIGKNLSITSLL